MTDPITLLLTADAAISQLSAAIQDLGDNPTPEALRDLLSDFVDRTSVAQIDAFVPDEAHVSILWSGSYERVVVDGNIVYDGTPGNTAAAYADANPHGVSIVGNTHVVKLIESSIFQDALLRAFTVDGILDTTAKGAFMGDWPSEPDALRTPGIWDDVSARFVAAIEGDIVAMTPNADWGSVFSQTEVEAILRNPNIDSVNGIKVASWLNEFAPDGVIDGAVVDRFNAHVTTAATVMQGEREGVMRSRSQQVSRPCLSAARTRSARAIY